MSLRRSARFSTKSLPATTEAPSPKLTSNGSFKEDKKPSSRVPTISKKRKSTTSTSILSSQPTTNGADSRPPEPDFAVPKTPVSKKRKAAATTPVNPPPLTPTPTGVRLMTSTTTVPLPANMAPDYRPRPAEPHATNAPLSTPGGSRVVAYSSSPVKPPSQDDQTVSPNKKRKAKELPPDVGLPPPTSTTETLLKDACEHLCKVDPRLQVLIDKHHCKMFSPEGLAEPVDPFTALASSIMGQQVSGQAAASIKKKFISLFPGSPSFPNPSEVSHTDIPTLRSAGLSQRKAEYIQGLASKFASGELSARMLVSCSDEELIEKLVAVRGLGRWSVEMFACFGLKRMDVFSTGDLGVQRGMAAYMGKDVGKMRAKGGKWKYMSEQDMLEIAGRFKPYRSLFMWYMWRIEDVDISVLA